VGFPGAAAVSAQPPRHRFTDCPTWRRPRPVSSTAAAERVAGGHLPPLPTRTASPDIALAARAAGSRDRAPLAPAAPTTGGAPVDFDTRVRQTERSGAAEVRELARDTGRSRHRITGYGDATPPRPRPQSQAVALVCPARRRWDGLVAQGVPFAAIAAERRISGSGAASLRLLQ